jgi:RNA polymerase sigma factor (sigma-70 family)
MTGLLRKIGQKNGIRVQDANQQDEYAEQLLIEQTRSGNSDSFAKLVSMHSAQPYSISLKILQNHADAQDNVQNALLKAYENIGGFEGRTRFSTWLFRIAVNEALMRMRQNEDKEIRQIVGKSFKNFPRKNEEVERVLHL